MTLSDLAPDPIPEAENAAPFYLDAYRILETLKHEEENIFEWIRKLDQPTTEPAMLVQVKALFETGEFSDAMELLDQATGMEDCQFDLNYDSGANMLLPHITHMMKLSGLLRKRIQIQVDDGNPAGAGDALKTLNVLASRLDQEPLLISQLVRVANIELYKDALAYVLAHTEPDAAFLDEMDQQLAKLSRDPFSPNWMDSERLYFLSILRSEDFSTYSGYGNLWDQLPDVWDTAVYLCHLATPVLDELCFLEMILHLEKVYTQPFYEIDWDALEQRIEEIPDPFFLSKNAFWSPSRSQAKQISGKLMIQQAGIVVELYRIRLKREAFPEDLSGFATETVQDPFSGKDLKYEMTDDGFRLYSVGPNQIDDHGIKNRKTDKDDLLWSHPYVVQ